MKPIIIYKYNYSNQVRQNFFMPWFQGNKFSVYHKVMI
jgi:hypothetical protein